MFIHHDLAKSCKHLANFDPVTPAFKRGREFSFTYTLDGVTAMPRGLHARLCLAFLFIITTTIVIIIIIVDSLLSAQ